VFAGHLLHAPDPLHLPSLPQTAGAVAAHCPVGAACPAGTKMQLPVDPVSPQLLHVSVHALSQQMLPTQWPELHSGSPVHGCPSGVLPHTAALQVLGDWQAPLFEQDVKHAVVPLQMYGAHGLLVPGTQVPVPLHVEAAVAVPLLQLPAAQIEPVAYLRHAPLPSQRPSVPQVACPWSLHVLLGSGSPAGVARHLPAWPLSLQEKQLAVQALSQQTPSAQKPVAHSPAIEQIWPAAFLPHDPPTQVLGLMQSTSVAQPVPQAVAPLHLNGEQGLAVGVLQAPATQVLTWVRLLIVPLQLAGLHTVPAG
jgi:hypothetical protein